MTRCRSETSFIAIAAGLSAAVPPASGDDPQHRQAPRRSPDEVRDAWGAERLQTVETRDVVSPGTKRPWTGVRVDAPAALAARRTRSADSWNNNDSYVPEEGFQHLFPAEVRQVV